MVLLASISQNWSYLDKEKGLSAWKQCMGKRIAALFLSDLHELTCLIWKTSQWGNKYMQLTEQTLQHREVKYLPIVTQLGKAEPGCKPRWVITRVWAFSTVCLRNNKQTDRIKGEWTIVSAEAQGVGEHGGQHTQGTRVLWQWAWMFSIRKWDGTLKHQGKYSGLYFS